MSIPVGSVLDAYLASKPSDEFLRKANHLIEENLTNPGFGASQLAELLGISRGHLTRQLLALVYCPPGRYLLSRRLEKASILLLEGNQSIKYVALATGFSSYAAFWKAFKRTFGCNPATYARAGQEHAQCRAIEWKLPLTESAMQSLAHLFRQKPRVKSVFSLMLEKLDEEVTLEQISEKVSISPSQLSRDLKQLLGTTPFRLLYHLRVLRAAELLQDPSQRLSGIAYATGFCDQAHFTRVFKISFGCSPRAFRRNNNRQNFMPMLRKLVMEQK